MICPNCENKDFIYESNKGRDIFFVSSEEDAIEKLSRT
jgi:hypothetical protein